MCCQARYAISGKPQAFAICYRSVNNGWTHSFRPVNGSGPVQASKQKCSKGDGYVEAVEEVLGVTEWFDPEIEALLANFRKLQDKIESEADLTALVEFGETIAQRGDSLRDIIARELVKADDCLNKVRYCGEETDSV